MMAMIMTKMVTVPLVMIMTRDEFFCLYYRAFKWHNGHYTVLL